jgi:NADP-dependent 3-hydroxy acid dehydrogenase YdfG
MREQKSGIIVNISSGAGLFGYPGGSAYVSSKFAIEGLSESIPMNWINSALKLY